MAGFDISNMVVSKPKPLPIILLLDGSGSMYGERIAELNASVEKMLEVLKRESQKSASYLMSVISFGHEGATVLHRAEDVNTLEYQHIQADGMTPLGAALSAASEIVENHELTPSRAYRPLVILICDGMPNDDWETPFEHFVSEGRTSKCDRMALAIDVDQGENGPRRMLERFVAGTGHDVMEAKDVAEISAFFKFVTMSVVSRTRSKNPNIVPKDSDISEKLKKSEGPAHPDEPREDSLSWF